MAGNQAETTLYVVSYDIPSDKRRTKVHKTLTGFGDWVQYSVFECHLTKKQVLMMRTKLSKALNAEEDRVRIYCLCSSCTGKVEAIGCERPKDKREYVL